jgi:Mrp family chromosome partitioning ATPase
VVLGALGKRELESGKTEALRPDEQAPVRRQAFGIAVRSAVVGVASTAIVWSIAALLALGS